MPRDSAPIQHAAAKIRTVLSDADDTMADRKPYRTPGAASGGRGVPGGGPTDDGIRTR